MEQLTQAVAGFQHLERTFTVAPLIEQMVEYSDIPFYAIAIYVLMLFPGRAWMKDREPFNLKPLFIVWNLLLASFSIKGALTLVPYLYTKTVTEGFKYTVCEDSTLWWNTGAAGVWMALFALSKIPELFDTAFLVFQKKPIIFLHWYHHITVMLYCWFGYMSLSTVGIWFGTMNYFVHAVMYSYYFMMSASTFTRNLVKPIAKIITVLQIAQMVAGLALIIAVFPYDYATCPGSRGSTNRSGLIMYGSYFVLFTKFFLDSYVFGKKKTTAASPEKTKSQ